MITATRNWLRKHRTTIAVGAGLIGTVYLTGQYVLGKITEARQRVSDDRIARENLKRRFEQNQEDCTYTVLALLPTATDNITKAIPVEHILQELQQRKSEKLARSAASSEIAPSDVPSGFDDDGKSIGGSSGYVRASQVVEGATVSNDGAEASPAPVQALVGSGKSKVQLWNDLKITSITRAFTLIYTLALLTIFTRIQLNLLGRRTYLSSVISLAAPVIESSKISLENHEDVNIEQDYGSDFETNRKYLTFSWWLLHRGWIDIQAKVEAAVKEVFGSLNPRDAIAFQKLSELTLEVRKLVEGATEEERRSQQWLCYLLPSRSEEEFVLRESGISNSSPSSPSSGPAAPTDNVTTITPSLRRLLDESSDLIESPTFTHVLTLALDAAFSLLVDAKLAVQAFKMPSPFDPSNPTISYPSASLDVLSATSASRVVTSSRIQELDPDMDEEDLVTDQRHRTAKLATILAVFTRQAHAIGSGGNINALMSGNAPLPSSSFQNGATSLIREANDYLAAMEMVRDLEGFAAVIYSSNFEFEGVDAHDDTDSAVGNGAVLDAPPAAVASASRIVPTPGIVGAGVANSRGVEESIVHVHPTDAEPGKLSAAPAESSSGNLEEAWGKAQAQNRN